LAVARCRSTRWSPTHVTTGHREGSGGISSSITGQILPTSPAATSPFAAAGVPLRGRAGVPLRGRAAALAAAGRPRATSEVPFAVAGVPLRCRARREQAGRKRAHVEGQAPRLRRRLQPRRWLRGGGRSRAKAEPDATSEKGVRHISPGPARRRTGESPYVRKRARR
jgi:hypothetical protein